MTSGSLNSEPERTEIDKEDAPTSLPVSSEIEHLLQQLIKICSGLESTKFQMTLRDRQTGQDTLKEQGGLLKMLEYLPECLRRLWQWNEVLIIESCDPAQDEDSDLVRE
jgi:hypothetical protein